MTDAPLEDWIADRGGAATLVITDVVRSTLLLYGAGTVSYMRVIDAYRNRATALVASLDGRVVDMSGDAVFAVFERSADAFAFATAIFEDTGEPQLRVRVGVHHGAVHARGPSLFGRSVHFAARLAERGGEAHVWASDAARAALEAETQEGLRPPWVRYEHCELPGVPGVHTLWQLARKDAAGPVRD